MAAFCNWYQCLRPPSCVYLLPERDVPLCQKHDDVLTDVWLKGDVKKIDAAQRAALGGKP